MTYFIAVVFLPAIIWLPPFLSAVFRVVWYVLIAILGLLFLALVIILKQTNLSLSIIASFFALLGIAVFVSTRALMVSGALNLSSLYQTAATAIQNSEVHAAWQGITSPARPTPEETGFFFMAIGCLIYSIIMLRNGIFSKWIAYLGILGGIITIANDLSIVFLPSFEAILMILNGLVWFGWRIAVGIRLINLARSQ